jgi:hypothetical protein
VAFSFGRVLEDNFRLTMKLYLPAVALSVFLSAVSLLITTVFGRDIFDQVFMRGVHRGFIYSILFNWKLWLVLVAYLLSSTATSAFSIHFSGLIAVAEVRCVPIRIGTALSEAAKDLPQIYPRVLKFNLLVMVMTTPGVLLFMISVGLIPYVSFIFPLFGALFGPVLAAIGYFAVVCLYYPFFGVMAAERRFNPDVFDQAAELTEGSRWKIFGLLMAVYIAAGVLVLLVSLVTTVTGLSRVTPYATSFVQALCTPYLMFLPTSLYLALNKVKLTSSDVAKVFA